jgi:chromosome partitioning protein
MQIITCASLSGGQGKTTTAICLGKLLCRLGHQVLMVDADPQASLTFYLGQEVQPHQPTLLEVLKKEVSIEDGIYEITPHLWLIPADDALDKAQEFLAGSGMSALVLGKRLQAVSGLFQFCIIDAPPQRSQLALTTIGAADHLIVTAEASSKGVKSLLRTLELADELLNIEAFTGVVLGVLPFRDRWIGQIRAKQSQRSIQEMLEIVSEISLVPPRGEIPLLPSILESEQFKKAIDQNKLPSELGYPQLEYPFEEIIKLLG